VNTWPGIHTPGGGSAGKPATGARRQILAIPTLVRKLPMPMRRIIGDLSNTERVLVGLDLRSKT